MAVSGTKSVVKFHDKPPSGLDISPPVAPNSQAPECAKLASASLRTSEMSSQPVEAISMENPVCAGVHVNLL
jgi:hypothetical protein